MSKDTYSVLVTGGAGYIGAIMVAELLADGHKVTVLDNFMFYELTALSWGDEEFDAIQRVVQSGRFTIGENVAAFEEDFAAYFGKKYAVMTSW